MKKSIFIAGLLLLAGSAFADNDRLNIFKGTDKTHSYRADDISAITYANPLGGDGMSHVKFDFKDGNFELMRLDEIREIKYAEGLPDCPISVDITPHHMCGTLDIHTDGSHYYRISGAPISQLQKYDRSLWTEILIQKDIDYINTVVEYYQKPLSQWDESEVFYKEGGQIDWFPDEIVEIGTPMAICLYTAKVENDQVVVTSEPLLIDCECKQIEDVGTKFNISADLTSTSITVKVDPIDDPDIYYNINLFSPEEIASEGLAHLIELDLYNLERAIYVYGAYPNWPAALHQGHSEKTWRNRRSGDVWVAVAYGVEYGVTTTQAYMEVFEIPLADISNECKFEVSTSQKSPSEMILDVVPSDPDVRYVAYLVESDKIAGNPEEHKAELYVSNMVYYANYTNNSNWTDSNPLLYHGAQQISTLDGVYDGMQLKVGTDYTVLICGVDEVGSRITELVQVPVSTQAVDSEPLTFNIEFYDFQGSDPYSHSYKVKAIPSDMEAKYVVDKLRISNSYAALNGTDEEFMNRYADVQGKYLSVYTGEYDKEIFFGQSYSGDNLWEPYVVFIYGYDGAPTGPLYYFLVEPGEGNVRQLRGPAN